MENNKLVPGKISLSAKVHNVETAHLYLTLPLTSFKSVVSVKLTKKGQKKKNNKKKNHFSQGLR